jgi:hypothetical protein
VGPSSGLDAVARRKKSPPLPGIELGPPAYSLVFTLTELSQLRMVG